MVYEQKLDWGKRASDTGGSGGLVFRPLSINVISFFIFFSKMKSLMEGWVIERWWETEIQPGE